MTYHRTVEIVDKTCGRVVLLNRANRVLLLLYQDLVAGTTVWSTPGGAVQGTETRREAAARELQEETGIVAPVGPEVWLRVATFLWNGRTYRATESFFLARVDRPRLSAAQMEPSEATQFIEYRWWNAAEISGSAGPFAPLGIGSLARDLVNGQIPSSPISIGL